MHKLRVLVVEDQPLFRQMLRVLLSSVRDFDLVADVESVAAAAEIDATQVDVALLDLRLPHGDGLSLGRALRRENPRLGVVLLSASDSMHALLELPSSEAAGWSYLSKHSSLSAPALVHAIRRTAEGHSVLDPSLRRGREIRDGGPLGKLTRRQRHVIALVADGLTNTAIAEELGISAKSVDAHLNSAYTALGLRQNGRRNPRVEAVRAFLMHTAPGPEPTVP